MSKFALTSRQKEELRRYNNGELKRINIWDGSVRSGKTWISLIIFILEAQKLDKKSSLMITGKTLATLKRNVLDLLLEMVGADNFSYSLSNKEGVLFGRKVYFEGAADARSEGKLRGLTLSLAYCDEISLYLKDFFKMLLSRLSVKDAKLFGSTNPDNPNHWLKKDYLDNPELSLYRSTMILEDNTYLPQEYIENLKKEYAGVSYDRYVLGLWKAAEGLVYSEFANNTKEFLIEKAPENIIFSQIGVDFGGNKSATAFVLTGFTENLREIITLDEWYAKRELTPNELENNFAGFVKKNLRYNPIAAYCDSAETVLINGLRKKAQKENLPIAVLNAKKSEILTRIRFYNVLHANRAHKILTHCEHIIEAFSTSVYDVKKETDVRLDDGSTDADSLDAQEYSTENRMKQMLKTIHNS